MNSKKIKVLYIITLPSLGGAQVHLYEVISRLPKHVIPYVIVGQDGWLTERLREVTENIYIVKSLVRHISLNNDVKAVLEITQIIKKLEPDIVHCHSSKAGIIGRIAAKLAGVPSVFTAHGWAFTEGVAPKKRFVYQWIEKFAGHLSKKIICVSEYDHQLALQCMPEHKEKLVTIYNGISAAGKDVSSHGVGRVLKLVMVARFAEPKDQSSLLYALKLLEKENIKVHLTLVGDGINLEKVKRLASDLGIFRQVDFLGQCTEVHEILQDHDIFILISNWEGFPISILEAMRDGLAVIASDVGGINESVEEGCTGFLIPKGNIELLAEKIKFCYMHPASVQEMGRQGKGKFEACFTSEFMMKNIMQTYEEVLK